MDRLLETLRSQGQMDSAGRFCLDAERGLALLARSHANEPHRGLLFAISSALLSGASRVKVQAGLRSLTIQDDGQALSQAEARTLFSHLVSRRDPRLHNLALALHTLSGTRFSSLSYDTPENRLHWTGKGFTVQPQTRKRQGSQLTISGYLPGNPIRGVLEFELIQRTIRESGRFVADRLWLNREKVSRGIVLPPETPAAIELTHTGLPICFTQSHPQKPAPGAFSAALWLKSQPSKTSEFILTEGGLEVQWLNGPLGYPGWEAVVEAPGLDRDLQGRVIINPGYRAFLQQLQSQAFELLEKVDFPDRLRPPFLAHRYPRRSLKGEVDPEAATRAAREPTGPITSRVQVSWDGRFAVIPYQNCLSVVEVSSGLTTLKLPPVAYSHDLNRDFAICPGTSILAVIDQQDRKWVDAYDCRSGELQASYLSEQPLTSLLFSSDGMTLFLFQSRQAVLSLDTASGEELLLYKHPDERVYDTCLGFPSPDGSMLAVQLVSGVVIIDLENGQAQHTIAREFCDWSQTGKRLLARTSLGHAWIAANGQLDSPAMRPRFLGARVTAAAHDQIYCMFSNHLQICQFTKSWEELEERSGSFVSLHGNLVESRGDRLGLADKEIGLQLRSSRLDYYHPRWLASVTEDGRVEIVDLELGSGLGVLGSIPAPTEAPPPSAEPAFRLHSQSELGLTEVWDSKQSELLVSYRAQSCHDPLLLALASLPLSGVSGRKYCLHPSGRWTAMLHRGAQGFHVLAAYPSHQRRAASAVRISSPWSQESALFFSDSGQSLALQVSARLWLYSFQPETGQLTPLQDLLLTSPHWWWSGEILYPYLEVTHPDFTSPVSPARSDSHPPEPAQSHATWPLVDCLPGCARQLYSDCGHLVSYSSDQLIVWHVQSGLPLWSLDSPRDWCLWGQPRALVVLAEDDLQTLVFYELKSGQRLRTYHHPNLLHRLCAAEPLPWIILIEWRSEMPILLDPEGWVSAPLADEQTACDRPLECSLSPDCRWLAVHGQIYLHLFDLPARSLARTLEGRQLLAWSGDSALFLTAWGRHMELRSPRHAEPILRDRPPLLTDRHQLNNFGDWVLYRNFNHDTGGLHWQGRRSGAPDLTMTLEADQVAQDGQKICWTRENKLFLADFPIFRTQVAQLREPSRRLKLEEGSLSSVSVHDRIQHWRPQDMQEFPGLGQALVPGRRAQVCALANGLVVRSSGRLIVWNFGSEIEVHPHQGWRLAKLQQCQGLIAHHGGGESGWRILDDRGRFLWTAPEVHLLNCEQALTRLRPGERPWVVCAYTGQPMFQARAWPSHLPLSALAAGCQWNLRQESDLDLQENSQTRLFIPVDGGIVMVEKDGTELLPGNIPLPLNQHLTWHPESGLFVTVYPGQEGGCRLCSYNLHTDHLTPGPEIEYLPVGGPRFNHSGSHVAVQVLNKLQLAQVNLENGQLEELPRQPVVPPGCGWGWLRDKLAIWRANWIQLHDSDGQARFRIYLRHRQEPLVVTPQGPTRAEALDAFI